uniref:leucine-rich repeat domain-containing protein n=1 Tax=Candidatus Uabimicrobium helgolandensis TaxID=3095367 RepID=UPI003FD6CB0A
MRKEVSNESTMQLSSLTDLELAYTNITELPKEIGKLSFLIHLDLKDTKITALPKEIEQLTCEIIQ